MQDIAKKLIIEIAHDENFDKKLIDQAKSTYYPLVTIYASKHGAEYNYDGDEHIDWWDIYNLIFSNEKKDPVKQHQIFNQLIIDSENKINWAHLCLGELIRLG